MNVAIWAEVRRLAEIEKLSGRAISQRLHCWRHTVAAALTLDQPPASQVSRYASILDAHAAKIDALLAKYPDLSAVRIREEIARGPDGYTGVYRPPLPAEGPSRAGVSTRKSLRAGQACKSIGRVRPCPIGATTRKVSVFVAVLCYSRLISSVRALQPGGFYRGSSCPRVLRRQSSPIIFDLEGGRTQRLGSGRLFAS
jgi:hypothetical protein